MSTPKREGTSQNDGKNGFPGAGVQKILCASQQVGKNCVFFWGGRRNLRKYLRKQHVEKDKCSPINWFLLMTLKIMEWSLGRYESTQSTGSTQKCTSNTAPSILANLLCKTFSQCSPGRLNHFDCSKAWAKRINCVRKLSHKKIETNL